MVSFDWFPPSHLPVVLCVPLWHNSQQTLHNIYQHTSFKHSSGLWVVEEFKLFPQPLFSLDNSFSQTYYLHCMVQSQKGERRKVYLEPLWFKTPLDVKVHLDLLWVHRLSLFLYREWRSSELYTSVTSQNRTSLFSVVLSCLAFGVVHVRKYLLDCPTP